jgi:hypothetical protein
MATIAGVTDFHFFSEPSLPRVGSGTSTCWCKQSCQFIGIILNKQGTDYEFRQVLVDESLPTPLKKAKSPIFVRVVFYFGDDSWTALSVPSSFGINRSNESPLRS